MNAFWLLCATLCLGVFFISSVAGILLANASAWTTWHFRSQIQLLGFPGLLFAIRAFPLAFGAALTLGFALPSFLLLEPKRSVEAPEPYLILFAGLGLAGIIVIAARYVRLVARSRKTIKQWLGSAQLLSTSCPIPVYQIQSPDSLIAVVGILRPKLFVGRAALASVTPEELNATIAHELAHVRSLDNFKQLLLKITRLPDFFASLSRLEAAWSAATEVVADANALREGISPIELSSAIVKVGRLKTFANDGLSVAACHLIPPDGGSSALAMRIQRLSDALEIHPESAARETSACWAVVLLIGAVAYLLVLPAALPVVHRWMEWFVQ